MNRSAIFALGAALVAGPVLAQPAAKPAPEHKGMDHSAMQHGSMAKHEYAQVMQGMHKTMM